jgi:murein DD-endopeptidase MepM/ murein hydrolase activator NlpD
MRGITILLHRDNALRSRQVRLPGWAQRLGLGAAAVLLLALAAVGVFYGPLVRTAARVPLLERELARLRAENARITELARRLDEAEARYAHLRGMLGGDVTLPAAVRVAAESGGGLYVAPPLEARMPSADSGDGEGPTVPGRWPLSVPSYRTRGLAQGDPRVESHAGLDLAVPVGSDVRASGGGVVRLVGSDSAYGRYVLVAHPDGYETMYGHLSRILVARGERVRAGQVIALSGNTGRSTAPHLHFEVRLNGRSVNPLTLVREGR